MGGDGDDVLYATSGDDILTGGPGDDLFVFVNGSGNNTITDFSAGEGSEDTIDISDFGFADLGDLLSSSTDVGSDVVIALDDDDSLTLIGVQKADLHNDDFIF